MEYKVAPSLLAADFTRLGEQVHEIEEAGAPYLHLDVMDGDWLWMIIKMNLHGMKRFLVMDRKRLVL